MKNIQHKLKRCDRLAFTLVELLVAIVIVGVLASLLITGVGRVRDQSHMVKCTSNLRQIGIAWQLYLSDHNGKFPAFESTGMYFWGGDRGSWGGLAREERPLYPYLSDMEVFRCPSDVDTSEKKAFYKHSGNDYAMANSRQRGILSVGEATNRVANNGVYAKLQNPSRTILVFEQTARASEAGYTNTSASSYRDNWHPNDVSNILMADGHVEAFERETLDVRSHPLNLDGYSWGWSYYSGDDW